MSSVRDLIYQHDLNPKRSLGQNFLVDESHLARIVDAAALSADDTVLEIGPGLGGLTKLLAQQAGRVVAVELDDRLIELLKAEFAAQPNVSIVHADILKTDVPDLVSFDTTNGNAAGIGQTADKTLGSAQECEYKVVANLPYYITNAVLRHILEAAHRPTTAVLMVQKEVAQRICAAPGKLSLLAVSVQFYARPTLIHHVPAGAFYPRPKVDSAVLHLDIFPQPALADVEPQNFFRLVKAGFGQKRKQLLNSLSAGLGLPKAEIASLMDDAGIDAKRRAETLTIPEWGQIYDVVFPAPAP